MDKFRMGLYWFGEEGAAEAPAAGAEPGGSETAGGNAPVQVGDTLPDGMKVSSNRVAAEMEKQMRRHPELREVYGRKAPAAPADAQAAQQADGTSAEADLQARWESAKKGEFAKLYGQDVQNAIRDRFKGQAAERAELEGYRKLEPMLKVLRDRAGVEDNEALSNQVLDDDSLYEEEANKAGMTVAAYKDYLKFKQEHDQHVREQAEQQRLDAVGRHYMGLTRQAEEMKQKFPDFSLDRELQNPNFLKLTSPEIGLSVEDAYFAVHHKELGPQMMAYGMQRAKNQMAQTIMANGSRPREGGLNTRNTAADMQINPKRLSRQERNKIYEQIHAGKVKLFNR